MEKSFATDDHDKLLAAAGGRAFQFFERSDQITKSASDVISRADIAEHMPPDGQFGVHLITMGAEEAFGPNRNGDSASINSLTKHHGTFEKFGHVFREHRNRDPLTQGIGTVRMARYNPKMHRGELIAWVDKDKAPDMYKAASNDEELSWSMSMRLPHDECSICRKKSKRTTDYCSHLRNHMLKYVEGHEKFAYARNEEDVKFFDISEVKRRADRIATYLGYSFSNGDELNKAASEFEDKLVTGAEWAEHHYGAAQVVPFDPWEGLTLEKLAEASDFVMHADGATLDVLFKMAPQDLTNSQIEALADPDFRSVGGELAKKAMILNFPSFASLVTGEKIEDLKKNANFCDVMGVRMPSLLQDLFRDGGACCGEKAAESVSPDEVGCSFSPGKDNIDRLMGEVGDGLGMDESNTRDRAVRITIVKSAGVRRPRESKEIDPFWNGLADAYGYYLVKAAHQVKDHPEISESTLYRSLAASLMIELS